MNEFKRVAIPSPDRAAVPIDILWTLREATDWHEPWWPGGVGIVGMPQATPAGGQNPSSAGSGQRTYLDLCDAPQHRVERSEISEPLSNPGRGAPLARYLFLAGATR